MPAPWLPISGPERRHVSEDDQRSGHHLDSKCPEKDEKHLIAAHKQNGAACMQDPFVHGAAHVDVLGRILNSSVV